ncbi:jamp-1 [Pristionchus pacificus]|nr:jamp-1 [Pristionchus pacificus]
MGEKPIRDFDGIGFALVRSTVATLMPSTTTREMMMMAPTMAPDPSTFRPVLPLRSLVNTVAEESCPGFCGKIPSKDSNVSFCGACPWGSRVETGPYCSPCNNPIEAYAWLYLLLVALTPLLFHCYHVRRSVQMFKKHAVLAEFAEHLCIFLECAIAATAALLVFEPHGSLQLYGCRANRIKQWYTWMHNPTVRFAKTIPCAHEVVYPLQSLPIVYLTFCLVNTIVLRSILYAVYVRKHRPARSYYASLFTLPLLGVLHILASGVIYHIFPYLIAIYSLVGQVGQFASLKPISRADLWEKLYKVPREVAHLLTMMGLFAFSIVAICVRGGADWIAICSLLGLVIAPPIFFSLTTVLTHPIAVNTNQ